MRLHKLPMHLSMNASRVSLASSSPLRAAPACLNRIAGLSLDGDLHVQAKYGCHTRLLTCMAMCMLLFACILDTSAAWAGT